MLALIFAQLAAPPPATSLGAQNAVAWSCELLGPTGEKHVVAGKFEAPNATTQSSYGSFAKIGVTVDRDTTGLLAGKHAANGSYAVPRSFMFGAVQGDVATTLAMSYFGGQQGGLATVTQTDSVNGRPTFFKAIGTGYCKTIESSK